MISTSDRPAAAPGVRAVTARTLVRGRPEDPRWVRPALITLLAATALLYLWGLSASGWANAYYSAAVQAAATSWKAFFFGSSDAANAITVDKTPAALWPMALAARIFGVNAWSILAPQALMGVATVGVLYAAVRRATDGTGAWAAGPAGSAAAGLLAGSVLALTPVATLMFRFNNPDALLVLLLTLGAYALVRAQRHASTRWLLLAAACVGTGFLAKMLQAFLVVPVFALVYLVTAPTPVRRRLAQLAAAGLALLVSAGWWVAVVALVPAGSRPYIGGSQHNSVLELALGYNGLGRLTGEEVGGLGNLNQDAGWLRLFGAELAGQVSWLLPAALIMLAAGLWFTRGAPRTDAMRASLLLWGGWLLLTGLVFSHMQGIFHAYYSIALAPAIGALSGMGAVALWQSRRHTVPAAVLAAAVAATGWWSYTLLGRTPDWHPWLRPAVAVAAVAAAILLTAPLALRPAEHRRAAGQQDTAGRGTGRTASGTAVRVAGVAAAVAVAAALAGPAAYAIDTAATAHQGAIPSAGPSAGFGPGRGGPGGGFGGTRQGFPRAGGFAGQPPGLPGGAPSAQNPGQGPGQGVTAPGGPGGGRGPGGLLGGSTPNAELTALLRRGGGSATWVAATVGSNNAAGYQLAAGRPVMAVGGFNGTDPAPTLEQFTAYVAQGRIHYFIGGAMMMRSGSGSDQSRRIASWVEANFTARTVGGTTVYDLTSPLGSTSSSSAAAS